MPRTGKRPLGKYRSRCEDNIKINLTEMGHENIKYIKLAHSGV